MNNSKYEQMNVEYMQDLKKQIAYENGEQLYNLYQKKINFWSRLWLVGFIVFMFVPINFFVKIALQIVIFLIYCVILSKAREKYLDPVLHENLDPQTYKALITAANLNTKYAIEELDCAYFSNDYKTVLNICTAKLADEKTKANKHVYLIALARIYFDMGDFDKLREICDEFDKFVCSKKNGQIIRNKLKLFTFLKYYLDEKFEDCYKLYELLYNDRKFCKTRLSKIQVGYLYAIACLKTDRTEKAVSIFEFIAKNAAHLNYGILAKKHLAAIQNGKEIKNEAVELTADKNFVIEIPSKAKTKKDTAIVLIFIAVVIAISCFVSFCTK